MLPLTSIAHGVGAALLAVPLAVPGVIAAVPLQLLGPDLRLLLTLACADADDLSHQPALGLLLLHAVLLHDIRDQLTDLPGAPQEHGVRGALGQLVDLKLREDLHELLGDEFVHVFHPAAVD